MTQCYPPVFLAASLFVTVTRSAQDLAAEAADGSVQVPQSNAMQCTPGNLPQLQPGRTALFFHRWPLDSKFPRLRSLFQRASTIGLPLRWGTPQRSSENVSMTLL
jgi:murein DD-endopeptidase MepM/ murein hydrolase activator NlpD